LTELFFLSATTYVFKNVEIKDEKETLEA